MKFILEVDMARVQGKPETELRHILSHWAGAMADIQLTDGTTRAVHDSGNHQVGRWIVTEDPDA